MNPKSNKRTVLTNSAKVTLTAASILSFIGGWNLIARLEHREAQANESDPNSHLPAVTMPTSARTSPTRWPTISPLAEVPPIPTLVPTLTPVGQFGTPVRPAGQNESVDGISGVPIQIAPLPTLAPLPELPALPPALPAGGGHRSGGS